MFDKTVSLISSDGTVSLSITAGTEGVKSIFVSAGPGKPPKPITAQALINLVTPTLREWFNADSLTPSAPANPSS